MIFNLTSGGASSTDATATAADILAGKTAYINGTKVTGTMTNNGSANAYITAYNQSVTIPSGYHNGSGVVSINEEDRLKLIPSNIKLGETILGVNGTAYSASDTSIDYTYTGACNKIDEDETNWVLVFTTSGTFSFTSPPYGEYDIYVLGGGQHGKVGSSGSSGSNTIYYGGAGGQGGFIQIASHVVLMANTEYTVTIGASGSGNGGIGGTSAFEGYLAPGGGTTNASQYQGGAAGGGEGTKGTDSSVYDFNGVNRGGGGGGGGRATVNRYDSWSYGNGGGIGEQGGAGFSGGTTLISAIVNYGGGGSGRHRSSSGSSYGENGGSGVVMLRNTRS